MKLYQELAEKYAGILNGSKKLLVGSYWVLSKLLWAGHNAAQKRYLGFADRRMGLSDFARIASIPFAAGWAVKVPESIAATVGKDEDEVMSASAFRNLRSRLEDLGLWKVKIWRPIWASVANARTTDLVGVNWVELAHLVRLLFNAIVERLGSEILAAEHRHGGTASIVRALTGCSLFTLNDDVPDDEQYRRSERAKRFERIMETAQAVKNVPEIMTQIYKELARDFPDLWKAKGEVCENWGDLPF
ncbi:MAG: hypothetical protein ACRC62_12495 [Microcoleus sp.]